MKRPLLIALLSLSVAVFGCHKSPSDGDASATAATQFKTYPLRGKVVSTSSATGEVTLDAQAIPGFMEAMTMPYKLRDTRILGELHPGDIVTADVLVSQGSDASVFVDHFVVVGLAKPDYVPAAQFHVPQQGDVVPDFKLVNQDGHPIHLSQFHGKAVLLTFIYTSCPLPDFCPRVTRNFAAIEKSLAANPNLFAKTHLIAASFDPANDTPARLKSYGENYIRSDDPKAFVHFDFAVASKAGLPPMARFFDVGLTGETDGTITHTLSTTLIGPDGKVVRFYPGNEWTPEDLLSDVKKLFPNA
ncbi:SCO family protein [Acidicapsa ligni]|uniref:SCO family protein n=1 Tax=Acidicapsa ligni TaxID=542300 RepID=UPI0021DF8FE8|nr:SCO family protein [Acidicapsa ligni]